MARVPNLDALAAAVRTAPGLLAKRDLAVVSRLAGIDGDDAALLAHGDGYVVGGSVARSPTARSPSRTTT